MAIRMPSSAEIDKSYKESIPRVREKYARRVAATTGFVDSAIAGEETYGQVMNQVVAEKRRAKGLAKTTDQDWKDGVTKKGIARIGPGMTAGADKRTKKYEPFRSALDGLELRPKTADPIANIGRVEDVVRKLVETKRSILGL